MLGYNKGRPDRDFFEEAVYEPSTGLSGRVDVNKIYRLHFIDMTEPVQQPQQARRILSFNRARELQPMDEDAVDYLALWQISGTVGHHDGFY